MHKPGSKPSTSVASGQQTIQDAVQKLKSYERNGKKWEELTDSVTSCICKDMLPINIVEKEGFRQMLKKFDSRYEVPSRKYFSQTAIPNKKEGCMRVKQHQLLCCHYWSLVKCNWWAIFVLHSALYWWGMVSNLAVCKHSTYLLTILPRI